MGTPNAEIGNSDPKLRSDPYLRAETGGLSDCMMLLLRVYRRLPVELLLRETTDECSLSMDWGAGSSAWLAARDLAANMRERSAPPRLETLDGANVHFVCA